MASFDNHTFSGRNIFPSLNNFNLLLNLFVIKRGQLMDFAGLSITNYFFSKKAYLLHGQSQARKCTQ